MPSCVSCKACFESAFNMLYCDICVDIAYRFWRHGVSTVNDELEQIAAIIITDGWLYIEGDTEEFLLKTYLKVISAIGAKNVPNAWEAKFDDRCYIIKLFSVDPDNLQDYIIPKGQLSPSGKVLAQPLFIKRKDID